MPEEEEAKDESKEEEEEVDKPPPEAYVVVAGLADDAKYTRAVEVARHHAATALGRSVGTAYDLTPSSPAYVDG